MAKDLLVSVAIGAVLQGSYLATFSGAKRTLGDLGKTADTLRKQHGQMGKELARAMASPKAGIGELRQQYDRLGQAIERVHAKHKALRASMQRGQELKDARQEHIGGMKESAATAVAIGAPLLGSVKQAAKFEAGLRDIAITGNLKAQEEIALGETMRQAAMATNQGHEAIMQGVNTLVAQGMSATEAGKYSALLGKTATATGAEMNDLAKMMFSLSNNLGIKGEANLKEALNRASYGAKLGQFELKAMAQALPSLASTFAAKGIKGQEALTQIIASLEVGRGAAGSDGEAVTNLVNWMSHMNTDHTSKAYGKAGVNYQQSMQNLVAQGYSSYEASLQIADKFITGKGDAFMAQWKKAGEKGDENAQRQLMESFGLNEVFTDIQTINHLLAMRQNWDKYQQNKKQMGSMQALGTIDEDYAKRAQTAQKAWERFTTQIADVAITIGSVFLPALSDTLDTLAPVIRNFGAWAKENPGVLRGIVGLVGGIVALRTAAFGLKFLGNFLFLAPANSIGTAWAVLTSRFAIFRALMAGGTARFPLLLQFFGMGAASAGKLAGWFGKLGSGAVAMAGRMGNGFMAVARHARTLGQSLGGRMFGGLRQGVQMALSLGARLGGGLMQLGLRALALGKHFSGSLVRGLFSAGRTLLWLGRAVMMNPIGLAVTAIALGAYLIYRHWDKIKPWFTGLWNDIKQSMTAAWNWMRYKIAGFVVYWWPVIKYVQSLPGRFLQFGQDMVMGLVNGIKAKLGAAVAVVSDLANGVASKFRSALGIKSPSRVFMGFGDNIAQGAAIGIGRTAGMVAKATAGMALATTTAWGKPALPAPALGALPAVANTMQTVHQRIVPATPAMLAPLLQPVAQPANTPERERLAERVKEARAATPTTGAAGAAPAAMHIVFSPQITLQPGTPKEVQQQLSQAMQLSFAEFERMMKRYQADQKRRSYGGNS